MSDAQQTPPVPAPGSWQRLHRFWPALAIGLAAIAVLLVVRPFGAPDGPPREVWQEWNAAIGRLGMVPVYPPREDLYVGDVLAILDDRAGSAEQRRLGNAIPLAHLDLRPQIAAYDARRVKLDIDTPPAAAADTVHVALMAYPGINVTHERRAASSLGARLFGWGAASDQSSVDRVSIPVAYSYGIQPYDGLLALSGFCHQTQTALFCDDGFLHRMLARAGYAGADARAKDGTFVFPVTLELVTRVYLTRAIEQQHSLEGTGGAALAASPTGASKPAPAALPGTPTAAGMQQSVQAEAAVPGQHTELSWTRADGSEIAMSEKYDHPLVFGYREVAIAPTGRKP